jgi:predicted Holliday junction resolvase-like endonuclease
MWTTILLIIIIVILALLFHDMRRILELQDELIKEQYIMRGELNMISFSQTSFLPENVFRPENVFHKETDLEKDQTTTVEVS